MTLTERDAPRAVRARLARLTIVDASRNPRAAPAAASPTGTSGALASAAQHYADAHGVLPGPEPVRNRMRIRITPRSVVVVALALALVAGAVALRAAATRPGAATPLPVPAPWVSAPPAARDAPPVGPDATPAPAELVVDVVGAVARPGVVRLPPGSRVVDALDAAGGALADADVARLNLARVLVDGEQVVVPRPGDPVPAAPPAAGGGEGGATLVDLNTADEATLDTLPGIGPVLAARIVEHRAAGPFASVDDLVDVPGIGQALLEDLRDLVRV
ncbi:ComEA family DNA-binding protein [Cellulomonas sp.]|uniref:ComEA family DNA-binding protein n=1 Tax=Cellulomonas sp. TaxID=40001 RepID=UPI00258FC239|nr:ComEA family DNA-binding protein [Cellulomonas sp.]MCR6690420.1 ComEA family DNA-binding protein [Cellulomonas sp.]